MISTGSFRFNFLFPPFAARNFISCPLYCNCTTGKSTPFSLTKSVIVPGSFFPCRSTMTLIRHRIPPINSLLHAKNSFFSYYHTNKRGYKLKMFISYRSYIHLSNITNALIHIPKIQVRKRNRIHVPHNQ